MSVQLDPVPKVTVGGSSSNAQMKSLASPGTL